ncbi:uncharacterized protein [Watersipora subatra]|uniref:uncharacterized protein n=1 Tax=Watersipora subatra TaxID=2589382 RepID=UPI00355B7C2C
MEEKRALPESATFHEFLKENSEDYGIEHSDSDDDYGKAEDFDDLPDLYRYLEALESAETDLDDHQKPPDLFNQPEHKHNVNNIKLLKYEVEEGHVQSYVEDFETKAKDEVLVVGDISLEEIQKEERLLRDEHIAFQQQELTLEKQRRQELLKIEEDVKKRVAQDLREKRRLLARKVEIAKQKERLLLDAIHKTFKRAENKLSTNLIRAGGTIKTMYGDLSLADGEYGGAKGRRWKLDWKRTPQPIQIKLKALRGVKDKLPGGRYVLMVSLYNRVGGSAMRWSKLKGQQWGGATLPIMHNGNYYNFEMAINQSVFAVLPPPISLTPSMVLVFELFLLRGSVVQTDRVVSWGCFPICDNNMDIIQGLYKAPFLRSEIDPRIDKHTKIEELISSDLDHWMCNLYFEVIQLPKYLGGQKEYEVELQFSSELLSDPEKINRLRGYVPPKTPKQYLQESKASLRAEEADDPEIKREDEEKSVKPDNQAPSRPATADNVACSRPPTAGSVAPSRPATAGSVAPSQPATAGSVAPSRPVTAHTKADENVSADTYEVTNAVEENGSVRPEPRKRPVTTYGSRYAKRERDVQGDETSSESDSDIDDDQIMQMRGDQGEHFFKAVRGEPDIAYKRYLNESADMYSKRMYTLMPRSEILKKKSPPRKLTYREKLQRHQISVKTEYKDTNDENHRHAEHVRRQLLIELGLSDPKSTEFWSVIVVLIVTFFIRIYVHYIGQWLFLTSQSIPINDLVLLPYTVQIMYRNTLLHTVEEIVVVGMGPMSVFVIFALGVLFSFCTIRALGSFPNIGHKIIMAFGFQALMDPFFVTIMDAGLQTWDLPNLPANSASADFSKLYWLFVRTEGTGLGGIFITICIYMFTAFISGSLIYMYFLRGYNNGRMIDVYWRLHSPSNMIYMPYDLEISFPELDSICKKAELWRGEEGERRKISVYDYEWEEEYESAGKKITNTEKTTHLSIHTVHLDGLRELYRHFLVAADGAILEIFAQDSGPAATKLTRRERSAKTRQSSAGSLHKVKGRQTVFTRAAFREDTTLTETESRMSTMSSKEDLKKMS